jgi:aminoglycoside 6'-N-acetyltransferase
VDLVPLPITRNRLASMIELRPMAVTDLPLVSGWLQEPHVAEWWLRNTTHQAELDKLAVRLSTTDDQPTQLLMVIATVNGRRSAIGWCQWYSVGDYPIEGTAVDARPGDCGIDYAIGDRAATGHGLGTELVAALVAEVRLHHPGCGVVVDPDATNLASRRVLEHNGFSLHAVRPVATESDGAPTAIYRLPGHSGGGSTPPGAVSPR